MNRQRESIIYIKILKMIIMIKVNIISRFNAKLIQNNVESSHDRISNLYITLLLLFIL